jgi:hypothetical protein
MNKTGAKRMCPRRIAAVLLAFGILGEALGLAPLVAGRAFAAPKPLGAQTPGVQEPLRSVNVSPADALDRELFGSEHSTTTPGGPSDANAPVKSPAAGAKPESSVAKPSEDGSLTNIARRMREIQNRLQEADGGPQVQQSQQRVVADLDAILRQAIQKQGQESGGSAKSAGKTSADQPAPNAGDAKRDASKPSSAASKTGAQAARESDPRARSGATDKVSPEQRRSLLKRVWGDLPEREREQMMQMQPAEVFLPKYEALIEDYFRQLSEGNESDSP